MINRNYWLYAKFFNIIYEATGILILAISAYIMTLKDKISLKKLLLREKIDESDIPD